jgi:hypothetical protein
MANKTIFTCILLLIALINQSFAQDQIGVNPPSLKWSKMSTPAGDFIYPRGLDSTARDLAYRINSAYLMDSAEVLINKSGIRITTILQNQSVFPEGFATTIPWRQELYLTAPQNMFMGPSLWRNGLATHEYRHAQQFMAYKKGWSYLYMTIMGNTGWLFATVLNVPLWYREGDAVDSETRYTVGGRGTLPAFHMEYRTLRLNGIGYSYEKAMSASNFKDFVPNMYRSGYYLSKRLRDEFGSNSWAEVLDNSTRKFVHPFSRSLKKMSGEKTPQFYHSTFNQLDSIWTASDTITSKIGEKITPETQVFEKYRFPQIDSKGNLVVSHESFKEIRAFKKIVTNHKAKKILTAGIHSPDHFNFVVEGNLLAWAEAAHHPRYRNKTFSVVKVKNLETGKTRQFSHRSKYFSPAPSIDGKRLAVVEYNEFEKCNIKIIDIESKKVTHSFSYQNNFLAQPRWINDHELVLISITGSGNRIITLNVQTEQWNVLLDALDINISKPFGYKDDIYFSSGLSGIENIYKLDKNSLKTSQVTNARFGAFDPFVYEDTLYFANYDKLGYEVWRVPIHSALNKPVSFPQKPIYSSKPDYYNNEVKNEVNQFIKIDTTYNKFFWNKLFAFTGWFPLVFPPNLGLELYTLNMERSLKSTIGLTYNLNENVLQTQITASYAKFFPVINANVVSQARNMKQSFTVYNPDSLIETRTNELLIGGGIEIPLNLTQGVYFTQLNLSGDFNYHYINELTDSKNSIEFNSIKAGIEFSRTRPKAKRQIHPPFSQVISAYSKHGLTANGPIQYFADGQFYFPSLAKTHSLNFRGAFQLNENSENYQYLSELRGARGYQYFPFDKTYLISANYEFPVFYPDVYLRAVAGITRIRINLFYDYSIGNTDNFEQFQRSYGGELIFDLRVLRSFNMDFKLQFIQRVDYVGAKQPFMFNIGVNYFELLN